MLSLPSTPSDMYVRTFLNQLCFTLRDLPVTENALFKSLNVTQNSDALLFLVSLFFGLSIQLEYTATY
jgi:hypothetical protein